MENFSYDSLEYNTVKKNAPTCTICASITSNTNSVSSCHRSLSFSRNNELLAHASALRSPITNKFTLPDNKKYRTACITDNALYGKPRQLCFPDIFNNRYTRIIDVNEEFPHKSFYIRFPGDSFYISETCKVELAISSYHHTPFLYEKHINHINLNITLIGDRIDSNIFDKTLKIILHSSDTNSDIIIDITLQKYKIDEEHIYIENVEEKKVRFSLRRPLFKKNLQKIGCKSFDDLKYYEICIPDFVLQAVFKSNKLINNNKLMISFIP